MMRGGEHTRSVEDMYSLIGRSPSEMEFQLFLSQGQSGAFQPNDAAHPALHTDTDGAYTRSLPPSPTRARHTRWGRDLA